MVFKWGNRHYQVKRINLVHTERHGREKVYKIHSYGRGANEAASEYLEPARDILQVGSQGFGFLQTAGGAGALIGTLAVAYFSDPRRLPLYAARGAALFGLLLLLFATSRAFPFSLTLAFVLGMTSQFYVTAINTVLQLNLPEHLRGRVMGVYGLTWDLMPVGGMVAGTIAEYAGAPAAVATGGVFVTGLALWVISIAPRLRAGAQGEGLEGASTKLR
jgi:predicted MFS family arabinose efflux permease